VTRSEKLPQANTNNMFQPKRIGPPCVAFNLNGSKNIQRIDGPRQTQVSGVLSRYARYRNGELGIYNEKMEVEIYSFESAYGNRITPGAAAV
jgi:hypothetical protein